MKKSNLIMTKLSPIFFKVMRFALIMLILLLFSFCGENRDSTGHNLQIAENAKNVFLDSLSAHGFDSAINKITSFLSEQKEVIYYEKDPDNLFIYIEFKKGMPIALFLFNIFASESSSSSIDNILPKYLKPNSYGSLSVLIMKPYQDETDYSAPEALASLFSGYNPIVKTNNDVSVNFLMNELNNYDVIYFNTHGGYESHHEYFCTGEIFSEDSRSYYENEGILSRMMICGPGWFSSGKYTFGLTEEFISNYIPDLKAKILYMDSCKSLSKTKMAEVFISKGVKVFLGWDYFVSSFFGNGMKNTAISIFTDLINGDTVYNSWDKRPLDYNIANLNFYPQSSGAIKLFDCISNYRLDCSNQDVYWYDSCGNLGSMYSDCSNGSYCSFGTCVGGCVPDCVAKSCGSDGCGGSCGSCGTGQDCSNGVCINSCTPNCSGKTCGSDGCGGSCGFCGSNQTCSNGVCVNNCIPSQEICDGKDNDCDGDVDEPPVGQFTNLNQNQIIVGTYTLKAKIVEGCGVSSRVTFSYELHDPNIGIGNQLYICDLHSPPWECPWNSTTVVNGEYNLYACAWYNNAGRKSSDQPISIQVKNQSYVLNVIHNPGDPSPHENVIVTAYISPSQSNVEIKLDLFGTDGYELHESKYSDANGSVTFSTIPGAEAGIRDDYTVSVPSLGLADSGSFTY